MRLAKGIGARTVAEGVETPETLRALIDLGCDSGQGYYLARPMPANELSSGITDGSIVLPQIPANYVNASDIFGHGTHGEIREAEPDESTDESRAISQAIP